jgi:prolyl oligopeptidase
VQLSAAQDVAADRLYQGMCYSPTLIITADHDDRDVPWHSYKFAVALQSVQICSNRMLIRVETRGGYSAGAPAAE